MCLARSPLVRWFLYVVFSAIFLAFIVGGGGDAMCVCSSTFVHKTRSTVYALLGSEGVKQKKTYVRRLAMKLFLRKYHA